LTSTMERRACADRDPYPDNAVALAAANAEIERGRATVAEQAVALHLHAGKARWD